MDVKLVCCSHSPLIKTFARAPEDHDAIMDLFDGYRKKVEAFDPQLVVVFGCDHFNGFHLDCMPSFCTGLKAKAVKDVGGTGGEVEVPYDLAYSLSKQLRESGVDTAVSYNMTLDHGFSQSMCLVLGGLDRYPTIPVFVNSIAPPYVPFKRSQAFGANLHRILSGFPVERVLVLATGGMSHNPTRYYPALDEAEDIVKHYQLNGPHEEGLTHAAWLDRLDVMHEEGAKMLVDGSRTREDIKMNPELDKEFAKMLCSKNLFDMLDWDNEALIEKGGIGFTELHTWVAATACYYAQDEFSNPTFDIYSETLEYGIGFGAVSAGF